MSSFIPPVWALRAGAWFCVALIAFLSLAPPPYEMEARPGTGLPGGIEHMVAYAGTAGLFRLAYPPWAAWRIVAVLFVYATCLEGLQSFVPGRSPGVEDAFAGGAGALLGAIGAAALSDRISWMGDTRG